MRPLKHRDLITFIKQDAAVEGTVDVLFMDIEGTEFAILPQLAEGNVLDANNVTVCQWNIEFHWPTKEQEAVFNRFVANTILEERYILFKGLHLTHPNVNRIFLLNVGDKYCSKRYLDVDF